MGMRQIRALYRLIDEKYGVAVVLVLALSGCVSTIDETPVTAEGASVPPVVEQYSNTLRWTTASEVNNFGFDVYRSTSEDGPFERITVELIAGAGTIDEPQKYVYVDTTIDPTKAYFYYVESISLSSVRERFSPIISIGPKMPVPQE